MGLTFAQAITAIRTATRYDTASPSPVTDAQITVWMNQEMHRFRRLVNEVAPMLYRATTADLIIASGAQTLTQPADFERLVRLESFLSGRWVNIEPASDTDAESGPLGFEEVGATFLIWPSAQAAGTYRIVYLKTATDGTMEVPAGLEDVIVERVCARVKERLAPEEAQMHFAIADRVWQEQATQLKRAFGRNNQQGFKPSYRTGYRATRG